MTKNKNSGDEKNNCIDINDLLQEKKKEIRPMGKEIPSENTDNVVYPDAFLKERKPAKTGLDDNVIYLGTLVQEKYKGESRRVTPEEREFIEECLGGKKEKESDKQFKRVRQTVRRIVLNMHREDILASAYNPSYCAEKNIVDKLDNQLTEDIHAYTRKIAQIFVSAYYGYDTQKWNRCTPVKEGSKEGARIADYRFMPEENIRRYVRAKHIFDERLEDVALDAEKKYLKQIETRLHENPLYRYVLHRKITSTDLF